MDVVVSAAGLVVTSPVLAAAAIAVRRDSPGPVIFRQERVGRHGVPFRIHKFRTMTTGSTGLAVSTSVDARITAVGAMLRRTKVDELPQLFDVLRGDMSLVGPRPEVARYVAHWPDEARTEILAVRPGITDPASIEMRHEADVLAAQPDPEAFYIDVILPRKVAIYVDYVRSHTMRGDVRIVLDTLRAVWGR